MHRILALPLLVLLCGCVEFEHQTILIRWGEKADVLQVRLVYQGIHAGTDGVEPDGVQKALKQLRIVAERKTQFFLLDNWPLGFDLGEPGQGEDVTAVPKELGAFIRLTNGAFFLDGRGRLCGWQDLRIAPASGFFKKVNELFSAMVLEDMEPDDDDPFSAATVLLWEKAAKAGHAWWSLDHKGIAFAGFMTAEDAVKMKAGLFEEDEPEGDDAKEGDEGKKKAEEREREEAVARYVVSRNRWSWIHDGDRLTLRLGADADGVVRLHWQNADNPYRPDLLKPLPGEEKPPELPAPIDRKVTRQKLDEEFARRSRPTPAGAVK
ncbi:MAG: hypothetical protein ACE5JG_05750 [Planctomycetota bacterium]